MTILGIETSCDETAIALVDFYQKKQQFFPEIRILADEIASQAKLHAPFGGVVPALAAREHVKNLEILFKLISKKIKSGKKGPKIMDKIDLIAVTVGPGLMPCLLTGTSFAKALSYKYKKPLIGVNHLEGHLYSSLLSANEETRSKKLKFPAIGLIVSGGHTELVLMKAIAHYEILGETLDDAAGEGFDKVARLLDLGYPGGPEIERVAQKGDKNEFKFPRPMVNSGDYNFSFAGLKTAVLYKIRDCQAKLGRSEENQKLSGKIVEDMAASFQEAVIETIIKKTEKALRQFKAKTLLAGGGVLANGPLRKALKDLTRNKDISLFLPNKKYCGDNAPMITLTACLNYTKIGKALPKKVIADPNLKLEQTKLN